MQEQINLLKQLVQSKDQHIKELEEKLERMTEISYKPFLTLYFRSGYSPTHFPQTKK